MKQDFVATNINQKLCTDITYIHTLKYGLTYLTLVMDFYIKKIIVWSYSTIIAAELALKAIDNTCIESFHSILNKEEVNQKTYIDYKDAYNIIFEYIELLYNNKNIRGSINY